jgi:D-sedoheptulose 7-phosphate isomerase
MILSTPYLEEYMKHVVDFLAEVGAIAESISPDGLLTMVKELSSLAGKNGRLFFIGVGGSAANCSHAVNDFRKLCGIEAYAPTDNVSEITARTNDDGWDQVFVDWLRVVNLSYKDAIFILSVGGGDVEKNVSVNIVNAIMYAAEKGARILGIVGRAEGVTARAADCCIIVPTVNPERLTFHTEAWQSVILHLLVSHPWLSVQKAKWESL